MTDLLTKLENFTARWIELSGIGTTSPWCINIYDCMFKIIWYCEGKLPVRI